MAYYDPKKLGSVSALKGTETIDDVITSNLPARFGDLKKQLAKEYGQDQMAHAWAEILEALQSATSAIEAKGTAIIPEVEFKELNNLTSDQLKVIKESGTVVIRNVVDDEEALHWKSMLKEYVTRNHVDGLPENDKQFFQLYWTKSQVQARSHPNVLAASAWLNQLYHVPAARSSNSAAQPEDYRPDPLSYADRFRIRRAGGNWDYHRPHVDGGGIERWEDTEFRKCFDSIMKGSWKSHDPYDLTARLNAKSSLYGTPNQATVFRTFQGWLALSSTGPGEGTLKVFPNVLLSNAYTVLRPFFTLVEGSDPFKVENWKFDDTTPTFPGTWYKKLENRVFGLKLTDDTHPNLRLESCMTSVPRVEPGDMVFWHCDVIHSVEPKHTGPNDSSVLYIAAVPTTPQNADYIRRQAEHFKKGIPPPDFPKDNRVETGNIGLGMENDLLSDSGKRAMGLVY